MGIKVALIVGYRQQIGNSVSVLGCDVEGCKL